MFDASAAAYLTVDITLISTSFAVILMQKMSSGSSGSDSRGLKCYSTTSQRHSVRVVDSIHLSREKLILIRIKVFYGLCRKNGLYATCKPVKGQGFS